ncbi:fimbrial protein [Luteibacter yeojuensis]|uniref:Type 1 fimbrial protein n=1 Tax=Luteibacter yeojuensis TaxID=345309 RepID=A0A7X5QUX9_9GAMM|nr:fimbrial protein [Luteibacter yeojuensis]NID15883.1 type 1 fimbrial protein [Luteibacter yeojuensis]
MYKKFIAASLFVSTLAVGPAARAANDGIIDITGRITSTTCEVEGQPPGSGGVRKSVPLDTISAGALAQVGQTYGDRGFTIQIGGNPDCADDTTVKVRFDPSSPALDRLTGRLNIDAGADAAGGVQIQIANGDGTPIHLYTEDSKSVVVADNKAQVDLIARYYRSGEVTAGAANSRVGFQVIYE